MSRADRMLTKGTHVIVSVTKAADGSLTSKAIQSARTGLVPPM